MKIKYYLKESKKSVEGKYEKKESLIVTRILWGQYQLPYSTKKIVNTAFWVDVNEKGERVQKVKQSNKYPQFSEINQALDNLRSEIQNVFHRYMNENLQSQPTPAILKVLLDKHLKRGKSVVIEKKTVNFVQYLESFIVRSQKGIRINRKTSQALSKNTINTYNTLLGHLKQYNNGLNWNEINLDFHEDYTEYLMETYDLSNNSIGKDFQIIKLACLEAYYEKINIYDDFKNKLFNVSREESQSIYLNTEEINILWNLDLSKSKNLEETRDLFILGCLTGLRYSDYSNIKSQQIEGFKINVKQVKGGKLLEVNVRDPKAQAIIKKYNKNLPKGAINQVFNRHLKSICQDINEFKILVDREYSKGGKRITESKQKFDLVKSHTARRSFCTNEVQAKTPIPIIMANSGHTTEKSFWKYVKLNKSDYYDLYDEIVKERYRLHVAV